jgi:hypothetical protein
MEVQQGNSLNQRTGGQGRSCLGLLVLVRGCRRWENEGEYIANTVYTFVEMEK